MFAYLYLLQKLKIYTTNFYNFTADGINKYNNDITCILTVKSYLYVQ